MYIYIYICICIYIYTYCSHFGSSHFGSSVTLWLNNSRIVANPRVGGGLCNGTS